MDNLTTVTASITYPITEIEWFADKLGYQAVVANPLYSAEENPETGEITDNGLPRNIDNPESRIDFVKRKFKEDCAVPWFTQFAARDAERLAKEEAARVKSEAIEKVTQLVANAITVS